MLYLLYSTDAPRAEHFAMQLQSPPLAFEAVREWNDDFLDLFPHRYDYIWGEQIDLRSDQKVEWKTESRHPLSDRLIKQGSFIYGVRFGAETRYCVIDIDWLSRYHPKHDRFAISRILQALEPLGLVRHLACTSSYSGGIHLYLPFQKPQKTWKLAIALQTLLENAGFKPALGQLELFPNAKLYNNDGTPSLYAAHRLPLQAGSYLLDSSWQTIHSTQASFVQQWRLAEQGNDISAKRLERILKQVHRQRYHLSGKADKFLNDLNAEIEPGWTSYGQTNYLLGRITLRSYIFGHLIYGSAPLEGQALVDDIVKTAKSLPGYGDWCRHQHEIEKRATEWAQCVENSRYFHFGQGKQTTAIGVSDLTPAGLVAEVEAQLTWNEKQRQNARDKIRSAIADLLNQNSLPSIATARFNALLEYGLGGSTLYRHRDLWHPSHLVENPPHPPTSAPLPVEASDQGAASTENSTSLLPNSGRNALSDKDSNDFEPVKQVDIDRNPVLGNDLSLSPATPTTSHPQDAIAQGVRYVQQVLFAVKKRAHRPRPAQNPAVEPQVPSLAHRRKMEQYLASGDPILMAEAQRSLPISPPLAEELPLQSASLEPGVSALVSQPPHVSVSSPPLQSETAEKIPNFLRDAIADLGDILAQIQIHQKRLGWTVEQVQITLRNLFQKTNQARLTDTELMQWLQWLKSCNSIDLSKIDESNLPTPRTDCQRSAEKGPSLRI